MGRWRRQGAPGEGAGAVVEPAGGRGAETSHGRVLHRRETGSGLGTVADAPAEEERRKEGNSEPGPPPPPPPPCSGVSGPSPRRDTLLATDASAEREGVRRRGEDEQEVEEGGGGSECGGSRGGGRIVRRPLAAGSGCERAKPTLGFGLASVSACSKQTPRRAFFG